MVIALAMTPTLAKTGEATTVYARETRLLQREFRLLSRGGGALFRFRLALDEV